MRWLEAYGDEEDVVFLFEVDDDGWVVRQVELRGADRTPTVAAALAEWPDPERDGIEVVQAYEARYGALADQPMVEWDPGFSHREISRGEFEAVWDRARAHLAAKPF